VSIRIVFEFSRRIRSKIKKQLESDLFEQFQEMRFQIDEHREKLKEKIDDIALDVINETKKYENNSFKNNPKRERAFI
jgi:hypothetical protein